MYVNIIDEIKFITVIFFPCLAMEQIIIIRNNTDIPCRVISKVDNYDYSMLNEVESECILRI